MEVATPQGFEKNPKLVLDFYNQRRRQLLDVSPNGAHKALADLEKHFEVRIITQNVDDLHERAGSTQVIHLHGELLKARSAQDPNHIIEWDTDIELGDVCPKGKQLRPHIVWFGEDVPLLEKAANITAKADILIIIGTSMQVYPAASLVHYAPDNVPIFFIDPRPNIRESDFNNLTIIADGATAGMAVLAQKLREDFDELDARFQV